MFVQGDRTLCISLLATDRSVEVRELETGTLFVNFFLLVEITWHHCGDWLRGDLTGGLPSGDLDVLVLAALMPPGEQPQLTSV